MQILPPETIIEGFVKNDDKCNYELYLVELLNSSKWFTDKYKERFIWCENQSHKECDTYSGEYGLDFKLIASKTRLQASNILSSQTVLLCDGVVMNCMCQAPGNEICATRLHAALRQLTYDDLERVSDTKYDHQCLEDDVQSFLKNIETHKNLMLFFPYKLYFDLEHKQENAIEIILEALNSDFKQSFIYRSMHAPNYDTFFVTLYDDNFFVMEVKDSTLHYLDTVPINKCDTFMHLLDYADWWE